ncbi:nitroreductase family protein, partial [Acidocella sp.]
MTTTNPRIADHPVEPVFLERWSPRAFTGEAISETELRRMFEAARWAPSSYNSQPWRFVYARRDNAYWDRLLGLLIPFNQSWAKTASALVFAVSCETMPGKDGP